MTEAELLAAVERLAAAADLPAITPEAERAKANGLLAGLAEQRVLSLLVPRELGGGGFGIVVAARAVAAIGTASGSAGLIAAMHLSQLATVVRHGRGEHFDDFLRRLCERQTLIASATSEVGVGGNIMKSLCATVPDPAGGYRLEKSCSNISYLDQAGAILATAMHPTRNRAVQRLALLEAPGFTLRTDREALFLGMRGIVNRAVTIDAHFPEAAIFPEPFAVIARTMSAASHILWAALWSGLAAAALRRAEAISVGDGTADAVPSPRLTAGFDRLYMMQALIRDACLAFEDAEAGSAAFQAASRFNRLKIACAELASGIVNDCTLLCGFRGYVEGAKDSLSEIVRDSVSARIMVSNERLSINNASMQRFVRDGI